MRNFFSFPDAHRWVEERLRHHSYRVNSGKWQGIDVSQDPDRDHYEVLNTSFIWHVPDSIEELQLQVKPHLPWAEDHFLERVGGEPLNPGEQYKNWPFYKHRPSNDKFRTEDERYTHSYMERYWPKRAGLYPESSHENFGIRYPYGDLMDLIDLLQREPLTRQAYLPVWFPEDTGVLHGGRVPCTLGYHFIRRGDRLHVTYYIRSCDFLRHFRDDVYMTARLAQWLLEQLKDWKDVRPGALTFHCVSMHMFAADRIALGWDRRK